MDPETEISKSNRMKTKVPDESRIRCTFVGCNKTFVNSKTLSYHINKVHTSISDLDSEV